MSLLPPNYSQLIKSDYRLKEESNSLTIYSFFNSTFVTFSSIIFGAVLAIFGLFSDVKIGLLGITLLLAPIIYKRLKYPTGVVIDHSRKILTLKNNPLFEINLPFHSIEDFELERIIQNTTASPFRSGNKKYVYRFFIRDNSGGNHKLIRLVSMSENDLQMQELAVFLNRLIDIK